MPKPEPSTENKSGQNDPTVDNLDKTVVSDDVQNVPSDTKPALRTVPKKEQPKADDKKTKVTQLGDFKLLKKLGQGGMGTVYLALQVSLDRKVALKTLSKELAERPNFVERFLRECRSMARLQHANVVQVFAADSYKGYHYVAIEFVDGQSLQDWMNRLKRMSVGDALHIILVCAEALKHAHDQNMIHRDIKPDNILLTKKGVVKLADFGLAKAIDDDVSMTASGVGMGTPLYMPPEQARNAKHVDKRTDIYALGTTLYYFLTGKLPYSGENTIELIIAKEKSQHASARSLNPEIPERLDLMIDKMLAKDPKLRYGDCDELIRDLSGLQLDSPSLSFIDDPEAVVITRKPGVARGVQTAAAQAKGENKPQAPEKEMWYVQHRNSKGQPTISRMDTEGVRKALKAGMLDSQAKAARTKDGDYIPLAQYAQFAAESRAVALKEHADKRGRKDMSQLYEEIDKDEKRRKRWRWLKQKIEGVGGLVQLTLYLALLAAVGYGLYWAYNQYLAEHVTNFIDKIQN
jgi:serine/threonine-protein kinase